MAEMVKSGLLLLMTEKCYDNYFVDFNFFNVLCLKTLLSKGMGIGIILGSVMVKVPQILKILANKSAEGLSVVSVCLDLVAISIHMSYSFVSGFPFSAWGDGTFLALQTAAIVSLIFFYGQRSPIKSIVFLAVYGIFVYILMSGLTPLKFLWTAQGFNLPVLITGKLTQAFANFKNGSTGQLSAATCFMLFFGSLARIFTSIQETGDNMMITTYSVSTICNGVIISQLLYYWNAQKDKAD